jgi:polysaccharide biosynthesis transport protein
MSDSLPELHRPHSLAGPGNGHALSVPYVTMERPPADESVDLPRLLAVAIRRRRVLAGTFLAVVLAVVAYTWTAQPVYQATARILVDASRAPAAGSSDLPVLSDLLGVTQARSVGTQAEIIKSPLIAEKALTHLAEPRRRSLVGSPPVQVQTFPNTDVIAISAQGHDPKAVAALANAVCGEYIRSSQQSNREETRTAADYVLTQIVQVREKLDAAQVELKQYKRRNVTIDLASESQGRVKELSQLESELRQVEADRAASAAELRTNQVGAGGEAAGVATNPTIDAIKGQLVTLELARTAALAEYAPGSREVKAIDRQLADAKRQLQREAVTAVAQEAAPVQSRVWAAEARTKALSSAAAQLRGELARLPEREYRLAQLTTEMGVLQQTYQMLNEKYQGLRISEEARLADAKVISPAQTPAAPVRPRKAVNVSLGVLLGLGLALTLALVVDRLDDRVHTDEDAETATDAPVLAYVPFVKEDAHRSLLAGRRGTSALLESFRMLRTNIVLSAVDDPVRSVAVTSAEPNEGKTLSSLNLAVAVALDGKQVILVDADLRNPSLHQHFGLTREVGLTNVVTGERPLEEALQATAIPGLRLLASGPLPPNPPELLNSRAGRGCLRQLKEMCDFLVVDTPPAMLMADAHVVASMLDGVMLVVSARESAKRPLLRTAGLLRQTGATLLGVLLNKADTGYGGYYGYRYGHYYRDQPNELPAPAGVGHGSSTDD